MGTKRKASTFEEDSLVYVYQHQQQSRSATPSLASSSPLSTTSPVTAQSSITGGDASPSEFHRVKAIPYPYLYLDSRTRKRHRDGRPDEEAIHENTLRKLYDAQRFHLDEAVHVSDALESRDAYEHKEAGEDEDRDANMMDDLLEAGLPLKIERNQRSIEAFFGGKGVGQPLGQGTGMLETHNH
ncbi:hypothetical protein A1O7_01365 [Cladophialophora yegresii CBS 114405]|uniref:Uncharacterized protein n=1 Tax=Cladophialophora yegresii CBS 114405 TaxID=1182544 RepID=W9WK79_9EURO|nr:uncharacterized protein A1O7_01365 [Cladophialophora yegresii CBS 114405]EXJ65026.1 hypothetical protein A1O7_01365 [Cladophialophora yegresii CBS 114405]